MEESTYLDEIIRVSRKLGEQSNLVLHGGGNTSIKASLVDTFGDVVEAIYVKGSGWDLATIKSAGFTPLRLVPLRRLLTLDSMSDLTMMNELRLASLDSSAPDASVETLLHSLLPAPVVLHSHADAVVTLTNLQDGDARVRALFGDQLIVVPYVMPGFDLAKKVAALWSSQSTANTQGLVLMNHGLFTIGATVDEAYERHLSFVEMAEHALVGAASLDPSRTENTDGVVAETSFTTALAVANLRAEVSSVADSSKILMRNTDTISRRFVSRDDLNIVASQGPLTPEHSIRTKRIPLIGRDVHAYAEEYKNYVARGQAASLLQISPLSPEPRVILDPSLGMLTSGRTAKDAAIASDIYSHTMSSIERVSHVGVYRALSAEEIFKVEYWELEQAKLSRAGSSLPFDGEVAIVTGAASGIGRACADALLASGAAVIALDLSPSVEAMYSGVNSAGFAVDVTDSDAVAHAIYSGVERFGGVDMMIIAAGIFAASATIATLDFASWRKSMAVNSDSVVSLMQTVYPFLKLSHRGGRVVLIASKNVPAPGPGAAAYSSSKAAVAQLARVAALEWAEDKIRVNMVHPDAVFDTALWTPELIAERASKYGLTEAEYKTRNLLHAEVTSARVASVVESLCTDVYNCTTGAQIPVDGGNDRVI